MVPLVSSEPNPTPSLLGVGMSALPRQVGQNAHLRYIRLL